MTSLLLNNGIPVVTFEHEVPARRVHALKTTAKTARNVSKAQWSQTLYANFDREPKPVRRAGVLTH